MAGRLSPALQGHSPRTCLVRLDPHLHRAFPQIINWAAVRDLGLSESSPGVQLTSNVVSGAAGPGTSFIFGALFPSQSGLMHKVISETIIPSHLPKLQTRIARRSKHDFVVILPDSSDLILYFHATRGFVRCCEGVGSLSLPQGGGCRRFVSYILPNP
jgi:hypothetical protein